MRVNIVANNFAIITNHNENYNVAHELTNFYGCSLSRNEPFEWKSTSLSAKNREDANYPSFYISHSSDESPATVVNGGIIGGNHGFPCTINIYSPNHGKTLKDVGSVYTDDENTKFTILRVINDDFLNIISENLGESECAWQFKQAVSGNLKYHSNGENTDTITILEQTNRQFLCRATNFVQRKLVLYKDGVARTTLVSGECDYCKLLEFYYIANPATVAPALTKERPDGGYRHTPDLATVGKPMLYTEQTSTFLPDGSVIIEFEVKKLMDIILNRYLGVMYQEKIDVFGGGIHRCLPKIKPFTTPEGTFDFSEPYPLRGKPFPENYSPKIGECVNPDRPFDRIVDYFRDNDGKDRLGFACGFLPVYDGKPEIRKNMLDSVIHIYRTRKAYPAFATGNLSDFKGVAYRKYFDPEQRSSVYAIPYDGKKYIYFDFFTDTTLTYKVSGNVSLFESDGVEYDINDGVITAKSKKGYAVFIEE